MRMNDNTMIRKCFRGCHNVTVPALISKLTLACTFTFTIICPSPYIVYCQDNEWFGVLFHFLLPVIKVVVD